MNLRLLSGIVALGFAAASCSEPTGLTVQEEPDRVVFRWRGNVEAPMLEQLQEAYGKRASDRRPIVLSLDSKGGFIEHGSKVISFILRMQATHNVDTVVEAKRLCASMCVPIYLAGGHRTAAPTARFMFHEVSFGAQVDNKLRKLKAEHPDLNIQKAKKFLVNAGTDSLFERYLMTAGANQHWVTAMRREVRGKDVWRTGNDLVVQRSGVVHALQ